MVVWGGGNKNKKHMSFSTISFHDSFVIIVFQTVYSSYLKGCFFFGGGEWHIPHINIQNENPLFEISTLKWVASIAKDQVSPDLIWWLDPFQLKLPMNPPPDIYTTKEISKALRERHIVESTEMWKICMSIGSLLLLVYHFH